MPYLVVVYARTRAAAEAVYNANHPDDGGPHRAVAAYSFPTKDEELEYHEPCNGFGHKKTASWTRHLVYGFMMCVCGGRHHDWRRRVAGSLMDSLGYNLLSREKTPSLFRNPKTINTREVIR